MKRPSQSEVVTYFRKCKSSVQLAETFYNRYEANGWTVYVPAKAATNWKAGRANMKDWKAVADKLISRYQPATKKQAGYLLIMGE